MKKLSNIVTAALLVGSVSLTAMQDAEAFWGGRDRDRWGGGNWYDDGYGYGGPWGGPGYGWGGPGYGWGGPGYGSGLGDMMGDTSFNMGWSGRGTGSGWGRGYGQPGYGYGGYPGYGYGHPGYGYGYAPVTPTAPEATTAK